MSEYEWNILKVLKTSQICHQALDVLGNFPSVTTRERWELDKNQTLRTLRGPSIDLLTAAADVKQY